MKPILFFLLALGLPRAAQATDEFPRTIANHLGLETFTGSCNLCHIGTPEDGSANQPLAIALKEEGLEPYEPEALEDALDALDAADADSDGDGTSDIDELIAGTDPNAEPDEEPITPIYGCSAAQGKALGYSGLFGWALLVFGLALRRR
jgi:uncharacterized protein (TIGR03382 family)